MASAAGTVRERETATEIDARPEPPWNVVLHNEWDNPMGRVVYVLKKVIPGMTVRRAVKIM